MTPELDKLERLIERELEVLAGLPAPTPSPEAAQRVKSAVRAEAIRLGRPSQRFSVLPRWAAVAAAILLAAGLSGVLTGSPKPGEQLADAAELLALWSDTVGRSSDRLSFLLEDGWLLEQPVRESPKALDRVLDTLDASFEQLGGL